MILTYLDRLVEKFFPLNFFFWNYRAYSRKGMHAIFQKKGRQMFKKGKKGQIIWKFGQNYAKFEDVLKKGRWLRALIAGKKLVEIGPEIFTFLNFGHLQGVNWRKVGPKIQILGTSCICKNSSFSKYFIQHLSNYEDYLWSKF